jgi:hypothetical protein
MTTQLLTSRRWVVADLTSGIGALILGIGIGSYFARIFSTASALILVAGAITHGIGMFDKHRLETTGTVESSKLISGLYWLCWALLAILAAVIALGWR